MVGFMAAAVAGLALVTAQTGAVTPDVAAAPPIYYGAAGSTELQGTVGFSNSSGWGGNVGVRQFFFSRVAPGLQAGYFQIAGWKEAWLLGSVRVVVWRWSRLAAAVTPLGGRIFLSDHADGWAAGGDVSLVLAATPHFGVEAGFEGLVLRPSSFCQDLGKCELYRPIVGIYFLM
jgi:hypothetical protein